MELEQLKQSIHKGAEILLSNGLVYKVDVKGTPCLVKRDPKDKGVGDFLNNIEEIYEKYKGVYFIQNSLGGRFEIDNIKLVPFVPSTTVNSMPSYEELLSENIKLRDKLDKIKAIIGSY